MKVDTGSSGKSELGTGTDENVESGFNTKVGVVDMDRVSSIEIDEESVELNSCRGESVCSTNIDSSISNDETAIVAETCSDRTEADGLSCSLVTGPASDVTGEVTTSVDLVGNICKLLTDIPGTAVELPANRVVVTVNGVVAVAMGVVTMAKGMVAMVKNVVATVNDVVNEADVDIYNVLDSGIDVENKTVVDTATDVAIGDMLDIDLGNTNKGVTAIEELGNVARVDVYTILDGATVLGDSEDTLDNRDCVVVDRVIVVNDGSHVGFGVPMLGVAIGVPRICLLTRLPTGRLSQTYHPMTSRPILFVTFPLRMFLSITMAMSAECVISPQPLIQKSSTPVVRRPLTPTFPGPATKTRV